MRILIVVDETPFYQPNFVNSLIKNLKDKNFEVFGAFVTKIDKKHSIEKYLISKFYWLNIYEILILSVKKIFFSILNFLFPTGLSNTFFSVRSTFKKNKIIFFNIVKDINNEKYLNKVRELNPDLIINSNSLIFDSEIIKIPKFGCLNRHTSLLPSYRGLWPVIHVISNNEKKTGVTIHKITAKLDGGEIYAQREIDISQNKNVSSIYNIAFSISSDLTIEAIQNLLNKKRPLNSSYQDSYFTFPTKEQWKNFRKNGGSLV